MVRIPLCGVSIKRFGKIVAAGEEGGRMAVIAHAENDDIERLADCRGLRGRDGRRCFDIYRIADRAARKLPPPPCPAAAGLTTSRWFERGLSAGTKRSSTSVIVTLSQAISAFDKRLEKCLRRRAAGNGNGWPCRALAIAVCRALQPHRAAKRLQPGLRHP